MERSTRCFRQSKEPRLIGQVAADVIAEQDAPAQMGQVLFHRHIAPGESAARQHLQIFQKLANEDLQHGKPPHFPNAALRQLRRVPQAAVAPQHF